MIYPREELTQERAAEMLREAQTVEVADILCHRLLRHQPYALEIAMEAAVQPTRWSATALSVCSTTSFIPIRPKSALSSRLNSPPPTP